MDSFRNSRDRSSWWSGQLRSAPRNRFTAEHGRLDFNFNVVRSDVRRTGGVWPVCSLHRPVSRFLLGPILCFFFSVASFFSGLLSPSSSFEAREASWTKLEQAGASRSRLLLLHRTPVVWTSVSARREGAPLRTRQFLRYRSIRAEPLVECVSAATLIFFWPRERLRTPSWSFG